MNNKGSYPAFPILNISGHSGRVRTDINYPGLTLRQYYFNQQVSAWIEALSKRYKEPAYSDSSLIPEAVYLANLTVDKMLESCHPDITKDQGEL